MNVSDVELVVAFINGCELQQDELDGHYCPQCEQHQIWDLKKERYTPIEHLPDCGWVVARDASARLLAEALFAEIKEATRR